MASVASDHPSVKGIDEEEEGNVNFDGEEEEGNIDLDGENKDLYGALAPGASAIPPDEADGVSDNDKDFIDNYDMLNLLDNKYTLSEQMVHYVGGHITPEHWMACKATLVLNA